MERYSERNCTFCDESPPKGYTFTVRSIAVARVSVVVEDVGRHQEPILSAEATAELEAYEWNLAEASVLLAGDDPPRLEDFYQRPAWMAHAACWGVGTDVFFIERRVFHREGPRRPVGRTCLLRAVHRPGRLPRGSFERFRAQGILGWDERECAAGDPVDQS